MVKFMVQSVIFMTGTGQCSTNIKLSLNSRIYSVFIRFADIELADGGVRDAEGRVAERFAGVWVL